MLQGQEQQKLSSNGNTFSHERILSQLTLKYSWSFEKSRLWFPSAILNFINAYGTTENDDRFNISKKLRIIAALLSKSSQVRTR